MQVELSFCCRDISMLGARLEGGKRQLWLEDLKGKRKVMNSTSALFLHI